MRFLHGFPFPRLFHTAVVLLLLVSCGTRGDGAPQGPWESVRETRGDTVVVRTLSGSLWAGRARLVEELRLGAREGDPSLLFGQIAGLAVGADGSIYVLDRQVPEVRVFGPDGSHRSTLGRPGEGPGELKQPDGGIAVLDDGRVLVRDPGNGRIQVFGADGAPVAQWPHRGGFFTSNPLWVDRQQHVYTQILLDPESDVRDWRMSLVRISPDGIPMDTLPVPTSSFEAPSLEARAEGGSSRMAVPFSPTESWAFHPDGYFVHGVSSSYELTLLKPGAALRIQRVTEPIPVLRGERREEGARVTRSLRRTDPSWRWTGPDVPDEKPPYRGLYVGKDGRVWVMLHQRGVEGDDPLYDPTSPSATEDRWKEPLAFDVFEPDGRYLGQVGGPMGLGPFVFDGDRVWAVSRDELGVQSVVRFRVQVDGGG
jgi:hypothetical protein